jgi:hypothetical protein|tara:strand:+ start:329 stop:517 length:189 start_codon:yes stop_codon:yes gene_type:complete
MKISELISILNNIEDKSLPIRIIEFDEDRESDDNHWLQEVQVSDTGSSGHEVEGEVRLYGGV